MTFSRISTAIMVLATSIAVAVPAYARDHGDEGSRSNYYRNSSHDSQYGYSNYGSGHQGRYGNTDYNGRRGNNGNSENQRHSGHQGSWRHG